MPAKSWTNGTLSRSKASKPWAVFDMETDPFRYERIPRVFAIGIYDGSSFVHFWGQDCLDRFAVYLGVLAPHTLYAHNGGRFDFLYLLDRLAGNCRLINGRIVEAHFGRHTLRDSFAIVPVGLGQYEKTKINYEIFEPEKRELARNRCRIVDYLRDDCVSLHSLVEKFRNRFGDRLTIAGTAIRELAKFHPIVKTGEKHDVDFRRFYFGGRVECYGAGILRGKWKVYDVNSMYPHAMRDFSHPAVPAYRCSSTLRTDDPAFAFAVIYASSAGVLPVRTADGLTFPHQRGRFDATAHEIRAGLETGSLVIHDCLAAWYCERMQNFGAFVDAWMQEKIAAEVAHDKAARIFAKLILNSAYGKFGQDPANYHDYLIRHTVRDAPPEQPWELYADHGTVEVYRKAALVRAGGFYDVAIAASITGAARAVLWRALVAADRAIYCDTDSIIAEGIGAPIHASRCGAWKIEAQGTRIALAGKKTYALYQNRNPVKWASKGVEITPSQICEVARGHTLNYFRDAPTMSVRGNFFTHRTIKSTL